MNGLQGGLQLILQTVSANSDIRCEGFSGIPIVNPCFIMLVPISANSQNDVDALHQELVSSIMNLGPNVQQLPVPCSGYANSMWMCHAHRVSECQKLLVLVGDDKTICSSNPDLDQWAALTEKEPGYHTLPIFPQGSSIKSLLPPSLNKYNAAFWSRSITDLIPYIFSVVGLTANEFRIFISYRRTDTQELAEQLFDELSHNNFDVYLDRFRTPPSVNFQLRLAQELADKSMVLVLESANILQSKWTLFEILFAKLYRLGLLALHVPAGTYVPGISIDDREILSGADFTNPKKCDELTPDILEKVVERIKVEHGKSLIRRRQLIRDDMKSALDYAGVHRYSFDPDGLFRMQSMSGKKDYAIWLTTRPLGLNDFQSTHVNKKTTETAMAIAPATFEASQRSNLEWLSTVSSVNYFDEGDIWPVAQLIAKGIL
jgi:hypothetical protein